MNRLAYRMTDMGLSIMEFLRENRRKLCFMLLFALLGLAAGIWYGVGVEDASAFIEKNGAVVFIRIRNGTSLFGYFLLRLLGTAIVFAAAFLLSSHVVLSCVNCIIVFYNGYLITMQVTVLISCFKLAALPFLILCYIPANLVYLCWCTAAACMSMSGGLVNYRYGFCAANMKASLLRLTPPAVAVAALVLIESILTHLLTMGMIL